MVWGLGGGVLDLVPALEPQSLSEGWERLIDECFWGECSGSVLGSVDTECGFGVWGKGGGARVEDLRRG